MLSMPETLLRPYCAQYHITLNKVLKVLENLADYALITAVAMLWPFDMREKQLK